jgi:hypothetical protein
LVGLGAAGSVALVLASSIAVAMAAAVPPRSERSDPASGHVGRPEEIAPIDLGLGPDPHVVAVGDSVMVGARPALRQRFGTIRIDAKVARQVSEGINRIKLMRRRGQLGDAFIIHLGNNGKFTTEQFEEIIRLLQGVKRIVFVNVKVPRRWEASVNRVIVAGVHRHPGVRYVNWRHYWRYCNGRVFGSDATHLTPAGARCYARVIATAI